MTAGDWPSCPDANYQDTNARIVAGGIAGGGATDSPLPRRIQSAADVPVAVGSVHRRPSRVFTFGVDYKPSAHLAASPLAHGFQPLRPTPPDGGVPLQVRTSSLHGTAKSINSSP